MVMNMKVMKLHGFYECTRYGYIYLIFNLMWLLAWPFNLSSLTLQSPYLLISPSLFDDIMREPGDHGNWWKGALTAQLVAGRGESLALSLSEDLLVAAILWHGNVWKPILTIHAQTQPTEERHFTWFYWNYQ